MIVLGFLLSLFALQTYQQSCSSNDSYILAFNKTTMFEVNGKNQTVQVKNGALLVNGEDVQNSLTSLRSQLQNLRSCNLDGICGPFENSSCSDCVSSCLELKLSNGYYESGFYTIINWNGTKVRVYCDMDVIGGGWTLASKLHYIGGWAPIGSAYMTQRGNNLWNGDQFGSVDDGMSENVGGFIYQYSNVVYSGNTGLSIYKLSDNDIRSIIGPANNFDVMFTQVGFQPPSQPQGNFEAIVIRNYTARYTFQTFTAASTTTLNVTSYRLDNGAITNAGRGIGCISSSITCQSTLGTIWSGLYVSQMTSAADTIVYGCGGNSASSTMNEAYLWPKVAHRMWVRKTVGL